MKICTVISMAVMAVCVNYASGQADKENSFTSDKQSLTDKASFLAQFLVERPVMFRKLLRIGDSGSSLLELGQGNPKFGMFLDFLLDLLPGVLQNPETEAVLTIIADELNRTDVSEAMEFIHKHQMNQSSPEAKGLMAKTMWEKFNKLRAVRRILTRHSARDFLYMNENDTISDVCYHDMMNFADTLVSMQFPPREDLNYTFVPWALSMFDAYGKPQGGITRGALYWVGSYDQCQDIKAKLPPGVIIGNRTLTAPVKFNGRFCRASFPLPSEFINSLGVDTRGVKISLSWGMCVPDSCKSRDVAQFFDLGVLRNRNMTPEKVVCFEDRDITQDNSALAASIILLIFVTITVFTTAVEGISDWFKDNWKSPRSEKEEKFYELTTVNGDMGKVNGGYVADPGEGTSKVVMETLPPAYTPHRHDKGELSAEYLNGAQQYKSNGVPGKQIQKKEQARKPKKSLCQQLIQAFSMYTNMPKLLNAAKNPSAIHCIHGIRFFSMLWIILGHTYNYGIISENGNPTTVNLIDVDKLFHRFTFQGVQAAGFAVDTFFLLSGLLVSYLTLKDLKKRRKPNCGYMVMFYFHRFWRLTPIYMMVLMTFGCLYQYLGGGPLWPGTIAPADNCKTNWWTNLLYVNNLVRIDDPCMGWSWYLANDMQFYIISPIFIFLMHFLPVAGILSTVLMMLVGIASAFAQEFRYGGDMFTMKQSPDYWNGVYIRPWCRVAAYTVGILLGYIMFKFKRGSLKNLQAVIGWLVTWTVGMTLCYITYDYRAEDKEPWARWRMALFESFSRPVWAMCVGWIIFACHNGKGGIIDNVLSFNGIIPLSRLTYAAYLVHPVMMIIHVFSKRSLLYINDYDIAYLFIGHTICTYMVAFFVSLVFEAPFLTLEKILFRRGGHAN